MANYADTNAFQITVTTEPIITAGGTGNAQSATGIGAIVTVTLASGQGDAQLATGSGNADISFGRFAVITLTDELGNPLANLTGLKAAWFDQPTPDLFQAPVLNANDLTTDGLGVLRWDLTGATSLNPGQIGWLDVSDSDGTTTQSPAHKAFSGPLAVT